MKISILVDSSDRVVAMCKDDLSGCTGWKQVAESRVTDHTGKTLDEIYENLSGEAGVPVYKYVDGYVEPRTAEEIDADIPDEPESDEVSPDAAIAEILEVLNDEA